MMVQGAVKEYKIFEWNDTWLAEIPKSEYAYANTRGQNVGLACRCCDCMMDNAGLVLRVEGADSRRSGRMALRDSMRKGAELLARIFDSTRA